MTINQVPLSLFADINRLIKTAPEYMELVLPFSHSTHIKRHRAKIIASRVGLLSLLFSVIIPLWIVIDFFAFSWPTWAILAVLRLLSAGVFYAIYRLHTTCKSLGQAHLLLGLMMAVAPIFYLVSQPFLYGLDTSTLGQVVINAYALLPFIVVAGLSIFPLTALEAMLAGGLLLVVIILGAVQKIDLNPQEFTTTLWLMILVIGSSMFSGMSQLNYMITLINQASKDLLTGAFTRRSGEEYLDLHFRISSRTKAPLSLLFLDIDKFKSVNDTYGHEQGDVVLRQVAQNIQKCLRRSDQLVRWGGEEFVVLLPNTDVNDTLPILNRISEITLGQRPDGNPVTVSIGTSELHTDRCEDWVDMIEKADHRMYRAKNSGRNKSVGPTPELTIENLITM